MSVRRMKGFSLIELMMVLVIAGVIIGIAAPQYAVMQRNARMSSYAGELVQAVHEVRGRAITSRTNAFLIQGPGASNTDTATVGAGSWISGWRLTWNDPMQLPLQPLAVISRSDRSAAVDASDKVKVVVRDGDDTDINGIGFNRNGRLVDAAGAGLASASIVICSPAADDERGRVITISTMGRVSNVITTNPDC